jgi:transcriptional regulator with XRE-family HTH domain
MCRMLHERLRLAREGKGLSLTTIARQCGVREQNLLLIERDAFEDLPTGLYGRNAVRAYASAVGIPADEALAEVQLRLRDVEDPLDGLARVRGLERPRVRKPVEVAPSVARPAAPAIAWRAQAAALIDGGILIGIDVLLVQLTALVAGAGATDVLRFAAPSLIVVFTVIAALYYVLLGGIGRATIGARIVQKPAAQMPDGADAHTVVQRGLWCLLDEASSLSSWLVTAEQARHLARTLRERRA